MTPFTRAEQYRDLGYMLNRVAQELDEVAMQSRELPERKQVDNVLEQVRGLRSLFSDKAAHHAELSERIVEEERGDLLAVAERPAECEMV